MNPLPILVQGTVKPDGTLELDEPIQLPPGRVQITVQPAHPPARVRDDWWHYLQHARAELEKTAGGFRSQAEIEAERDSFRAGDDR